MRTVILVPRRAGIPERERIWEWCRARWETVFPDLPVYEGHHDDGPFNRSAAINLAGRLADEDGRWDQAVIIDADVVIEPRGLRDAMATAQRTRRVTWAFQWWAGATRESADRLLAGELDPDEILAELRALQATMEPNEVGIVPAPAAAPAGFEKVNPISWSCCFVVPRETFDAVGGFDERFAGWGWEDLAFQAAIAGLHGYEREPGAVLHLWHPRAPGLGQDGVNKRRNRQLGRRYMVALRARGMHDRAKPSTVRELERDRLHLMRLALSEETNRGKPAPDLPDWREWWPDLEELVESWRQRRPAGPPRRVLFLVRSGGSLDAWPARREYLRQMLASLAENVPYDPAVRVVFSDWPQPVTAELAAMVEPFGFYVVGEGNLGFTASMERLWAYLASRKWPFDYVFLAEDDFLFERPVDLGQMQRILDQRPDLVQVALLRDACYQGERDRGGILGHPADAFEQMSEDGLAWLEHRRFFTLNPTLFRRSLTGQPWPRAKHSEAVFGRKLFEDPASRSALWGDGSPWIRHLGEVRAGSGY